MMPYQNQTVDFFVRLLSDRPADILEIGSDMSGEVASALAFRTGARVVGINCDTGFPQAELMKSGNPVFIKADGRSLPFPDNSFDAILSVATLEHVNGIDVFLSEIRRVLKPKGLFYTSFGPIWSNARGHHVFAKAGSKEARFWKPGRNPIPDYAHLLMTPDEMRIFLREGPCCEELIEPIIEWIYHGDGINRCHFEEYIEAFHRSHLKMEKLAFHNYGSPDEETARLLHARYPKNGNFNCSAISVILWKGTGKSIEDFIFRWSFSFRLKLREVIPRLLSGIRVSLCRE
jgi:SAM-dependent methyltransferase